jgi:hypothetical protein
MKRANLLTGTHPVVLTAVILLVFLVDERKAKEGLARQTDPLGSEKVLGREKLGLIQCCSSCNLH